MHLTETCVETMPHFIAHVETATATTRDEAVVTTIHQDLAAKDLLPVEIWVGSPVRGNCLVQSSRYCSSLRAGMTTVISIATP